MILEGYVLKIESNPLGQLVELGIGHGTGLVKPGKTGQEIGKTRN